MSFIRPESDPPSQPGIYAVDDLLSEETWRAVDIATAGLRPERALFFEREKDSFAENWEAWVSAGFSQFDAPHLMAAREAATQGILELAEQDRKFRREASREQQKASTEFGQRLLEASLGARHLPEMEKMHRFVGEERCPGHALSILALRSVLFGVTTVNTLIAGLYCEWQGADADAHRGTRQEADDHTRFGAMNGSLPRHLPTWLQSGGNNAFQSGAGR